MSDDQYMVVKRSGKWWILIDGGRQGPFETHDAAIAWAVEQAKIEERRGASAQVSWDDPEDGFPTVYKSRA
ncbi:hypothetical protein N8D56_27315 (plasmid) [Devosia sp. A8/3-2]|nr:hypothetical protein N8D56_27315 [Devosia sp. A8/3-2]